MKVGILSDIHSNLEALEAVIGFLSEAGVTGFVCCGDIVGYGADPHECIEKVRGLAGPVVAGNHDHGAVGRVPLSRFNDVARVALSWTAGQLAEGDRAYLESLPLVDRYGRLLLVHSAPSAPEQWDYIVSVHEAEEEMRFFAEAACIVGHSHSALAVERRRGVKARLVREPEFELRPDAQYLVNAGSVGQPRDSDPRACCVVYDSTAGTMAFERVEYDIKSAQDKIRSAGLPGFLADRLELGH